jgi:hypothetical protein
MTAKDIKRYIRYIADWRLGQLGLPEIYMVDDHPLPWLAPLLNGVEHANFFETRATEYSKGATRGDWNYQEHMVQRCNPSNSVQGPAGRLWGWNRLGLIMPRWLRLNPTMPIRCGSIVRIGMCMPQT